MLAKNALLEAFLRPHTNFQMDGPGLRTSCMAAGLYMYEVVRELMGTYWSAKDDRHVIVTAARLGRTVVAIANAMVRFTVE